MKCVSITGRNVSFLQRSQAGRCLFSACAVKLKVAPRPGLLKIRKYMWRGESSNGPSRKYRQASGVMPCSDSQILLRCLQLHMSACLAGASVRYVVPSWPWHLHYKFKQPDNVAPLHCAILRLLHALQLPEQLFAQLLQLLWH